MNYRIALAFLESSHFFSPVARSVGRGRESREASSRSRFSSTRAFTGFLLDVVAERPLLLSLLPLLLPFRELSAMVKSCTVVEKGIREVEGKRCDLTSCDVEDWTHRQNFLIPA